MSESSRWTPRAVAWSLGIVVPSLIVVLAGFLAKSRVPSPVARGYPSLFAKPPACPREFGAESLAISLEEKGRLREDRYFYEPSDGIRAVRRYLEAAACYRSTGRREGSARATTAASRLSRRVDADYAAARLNLVNALQREQWKTALTELRRLRSLTRDVEAHAYVDWLEEIRGQVAVRAASVP